MREPTVASASELQPPDVPGVPGMQGGGDARASILVVEDDAAHAEAITRALDSVRDRYRVRLVGSLDEGRLALAAEQPALVLSDLNLRDGKGYELLPGPHKRAPFPLLVLTSHGDERMAVQSIRSGAIDYVIKSPESFADLPGTIARALREWRLIEERRLAEQALLESEERFRVLFAAAPDATLICDESGRVLDANRAAQELFERSRAQLCELHFDALGLQGEDASLRARRLEAQAAGRSSEPEPLYLDVRAGRRELELRTVPLQLQNRSAVLACVQDVSARREAERARLRLEEQLHQASKLEAIGRLAGGVAHDFNNLLTAISGYASLVLSRQAPGSSSAADITEILNATQRAAGLTNQLLAFSRKQIIKPRVIDLNALLQNATRMLERMIGEDIRLVFEPGPELGAVQVDPNQVEQILINLAINARDAMPHGGRLCVRTRNAQLQAGELPSPEAQPGSYVVLSVQDDGEGMSQETLDRLFEPFFTTKELGRGTGLGLSIVYGAVKQNGGFIVVRSTPTAGSCFDIYLPRRGGAPEPERRESQRVAPRGNETLLLVEDEPSVREVTAQFLRKAGYEVLVATQGSEALELCRSRERRIDLLVTDVVLPLMNGRQLFERLRALRPGLRVVYMSGYTADVIAQHGLLDLDVAFVEKPFSAERLARKVREALDRT